MRQLHFVGVTDDRQGLIFADALDSSGVRYSISVDDALIGVLEEVRSSRRVRPLRAPGHRSGGSPDVTGGRRPTPDHRPTFPTKAPMGGLTPREMQARLRAGRTVSDVAIEAGVDDAWVERFAVPILAEQHAAIQRAAEMVLERPRRGLSSLPLGPAVRRNLLQKGIRLLDDDLAACWSAFLHDGSQWVIRFTFRSRGRVIESEWLADLQAGTVLAVNRTAALLGYVAPPPATGPDRAAIDLTVRESTRPIRRPVSPGSGERSADLSTRMPSNERPSEQSEDVERPDQRLPGTAAFVRTRPRVSSVRVPHPDATSSDRPPGGSTAVRPASAPPTRAASAAKAVAAGEAAPAAMAPAKKARNGRKAPTVNGPDATRAPTVKAPTVKAPTKKVPTKKVPTAGKATAGVSTRRAPTEKVPTEKAASARRVGGRKPREPELPPPPALF